MIEPRRQFRHPFFVNSFLAPFGLGMAWKCVFVFCTSWIVLGPNCVQSQTKDDDKIWAVKNIWPDDVTIENLAPTPTIESAYTELWMEALRHDEADLKQELISILEQIHRKGIGQSEHVEAIRSLLKDDNHHTVNVAVASLLVAMNDQSSAKLLFEMIRPDQIEISQIVEPALAQWNYVPAIEFWRQRLSDKNVRRTHLLLAIEGLGSIGDETSLEPLLKLVMDLQYERPSIRLAAARAVGSIGGEDLVERCLTLANSETPNLTLNRLCSIAMLANQDSEGAVSLLHELMCDESGAVAGAAWQRMNEIDSAKALPFTERCIGSEDPIVRESIVTTWFEQPTLERIDKLGEMLADRHPDVRIAARIALRRLAESDKQFDLRVRQAGMKAVRSRGYQEIEQGLILLAALDHKQVASRAVELLSHEHPNAFVTAAWVLRRLQVKATFEPMLRQATRFADREISKLQSGTPVSFSRLDQLAHLFDAFGEAKYRAAEDLLRRFIPVVPNTRDTTNPKGLGPNSRAAAITALGKIYRDKPDGALVGQLVQRMNARGRAGGFDIPEVWATSAIALGRMNAESELEELRKYYTGGPPVDGVNYAAAWSIRELTGETFPPPVSRILSESKFDLTPAGPRLPTSNDDD